MDGNDEKRSRVDKIPTAYGRRHSDTTRITVPVAPGFVLVALEAGRRFAFALERDDASGWRTWVIAGDA